MNTLPKSEDQNNQGTSLQAASLLLDLPEEAKLYVDEQQIPIRSGQRRFHTPPLEPGQTFFYDVRVVLEKDGQQVEERKRVLVHAGETVEASFAGLMQRFDRMLASAK